MHPIDSFAPYVVLFILLGLTMILLDSLIRWSVRKVREEDKRTRLDRW